MQGPGTVGGLGLGWRGRGLALPAPPRPCLPACCIVGFPTRVVATLACGPCEQLTNARTPTLINTPAACHLPCSAREVISELDTLAGGCVLCHEVDFQRGGFGPRTIMLCDQVRARKRT